MDRSSFTGYRNNPYTVEKSSVLTIDFYDSEPTFFRIQNFGTQTLYCSCHRMPTLTMYDFKIEPGTANIWVEPVRQSKLHIYNPGAVDVNCKVMSLYTPFEASALAMSGLKIELDTSNLELSSKITSITTPLPSGSNKIGSVGLSGAIPAGTNKIGSVDVANLIDYTAALNEINDLLHMNVPLNLYCDENTNVSGQTVVNGMSYCHIHILSNDGNTDMILTFQDSKQNTSSFTLKAGETIQDFKFVGSLTLSGTNYSYRVMFSLG